MASLSTRLDFPRSLESGLWSWPTEKGGEERGLISEQRLVIEPTFQLANRNGRTVGGEDAKRHVGFPTNELCLSQSMNFDWPDTTEAIRKLSKRFQKLCPLPKVFRVAL